MSNDSYEFSEDENHIISAMARQMWKVGVSFLVTGIFSMVWFLLAALRGHNEIAALPLAGFFMASGVLTLRSERAFRRIVDTKGNDILYTLDALSKLRHIYTLTFWLVILCLLFVLISIPVATDVF